MGVSKRVLIEVGFLEMVPGAGIRGTPGKVVRVRENDTLKRSRGSVEWRRLDGLLVSVPTTAVRYFLEEDAPEPGDDG